MTFEIWSLVLGSTLLGSLITAFVTKKNADKNQMMQYIVQERKKWRDDIRSETEKIIYSKNISAIKKYKSYMQIRLNPDDDKHILDQIDKIINEQEKQEEWEKYSGLVARLLKNDWERSKNEVTSGVILKMIAILVLVISGYVFVMYDSITKYLIDIPIPKSELAIMCFGLGIYLLVCYFIKYLVNSLFVKYLRK